MRERPIAIGRATIYRWGAVGVVLSTFGLMLATEPALAMVWDEGCTLGREARVRAWFQLLRDPNQARGWQDPPEFDLVPGDRPEGRPEIARVVERRSDLVRSELFAWFWPFAREEPHGHPALYALVGLVGDALVPSWDLLPRARLGPILAFSLAAGAIFASLGLRGGLVAGVGGAVAWVLHPHLFALGHYAHYDGLLSALWVGSILAFNRAVEPRSEAVRLVSGEKGSPPRWGSVVLFGVFTGWAAATKFTGWFLFIPFIAWAGLTRKRSAVSTLVFGGLVAALTLYVFNPPFWGDPVGGVQRFLASNLSRSETIPLPVLFLGKVIKTPIQSLPWYNTLLWTVAATPAGILLLAVIGGAWSARQAIGEFSRLTWLDSPWAALPSLAILHVAFLLVLRALPHTPGHDGVRLFLPAFGCLALLAGVGAARLCERFGRWGKVVTGVAVAEAAVGLALIFPVPLSYYSPLIGGLPGAARLGLEPTYYWDALDGQAIAWLNQHTPPGEAVQFAMFPRSVRYLHQIGKLRPEPVSTDSPRPATWFVLQNRPGMFRAVDRRLVAEAEPQYVVSKWGVPLLLIYAGTDVERLAAVSERERNSPRQRSRR